MKVKNLSGPICASIIVLEIWVSPRTDGGYHTVLFLHGADADADAGNHGMLDIIIVIAIYEGVVD